MHSVNLAGDLVLAIFVISFSDAMERMQKKKCIMKSLSQSKHDITDLLFAHKLPYFPIQQPQICERFLLRWPYAEFYLLLKININTQLCGNTTWQIFNVTAYEPLFYHTFHTDMSNVAVAFWFGILPALSF
jgi:hypothetical protein